MAVLKGVAAGSGGGGGTTLPDQTGNAGKFLTTDGATLAWDVVSSSSGEALVKTFTQTGHGFSVGNWVYSGGSGYALTLSDSPTTSDAVGVVSAVPSADSFTISLPGSYVTGLSGLTPDSAHFLSDTIAGAITSTAPTTEGHVIKAVLIADSATSGYVQIQLGVVITPIPVAGFSDITDGTNTEATMVVGSGASIVPSGSGIIQPTTIAGLVNETGDDLTRTGSGTTADPYQFDVSAAVKGGAASLAARLTASDYASLAISGPVITGNWYDQSTLALARTALNMGTGGINLSRFIPAQNITIDQLALRVTTASAIGVAKVLIYASGADGLPSALIHATGDLATNAIATVTASFNYTFLADTIYWVGVHNSVNGAAFRSLAVGALPSLGLSTVDGTAHFAALSRGVLYLSGPPNPWNFVSTDLASVGAVAVNMRAA